MTYGNCFEGYLTEGCKDCGFWSDKNNYKGYIGCGYCGPIMNCTHFAKKFEEDAKKRREKDQKRKENGTMKGNIKKITKEEFMEATRTKPDCWIFKNMGEHPRFWRDSLEGCTDHYYFDDGNGTVHRFKDMPEYGEIYHAVREANTDNPWSIWSTWCQY